MNKQKVIHCFSEEENLKVFMKNLLVSVLCDVSSVLNLPRYLGRFRRDRIIVLLYHGIIKSYPQSPLRNIFGMNISREDFENQMAYLSVHCNVISASEAIAGERISFTKKNVVIVFDDGYRNNYTNAFPILTKYNFPALLAVPTGFIVDRVPLWNDIIEHVVSITDKKLLHINWEGIHFDFRLATTTDKTKFFRWLFFKCVKIMQEERDQFIGNIVKGLDVSIDNDGVLENPDYEPLSVREIKIMSESKMAEFASHSVHHFLLSHVNKNTLRDELINSKIAIEDMTGLPCRYLSLPGGFYNNSVIDMILDAGFEKIFSSEHAEFYPGNPDDIIGRYCITRSRIGSVFKDIVHGPFHWLYYSLKTRGKFERKTKYDY